ncbi:hypothetical protein P8452_61717 [Trifolium repens]|nr:hypothetical protein P8452_61717 [Trifolium repens]
MHISGTIPLATRRRSPPLVSLLDATAAMKRCKILNSELPDYVSELDDCVLSYILSKLSLKDLVKTRALSKHWLHK